MLRIGAVTDAATMADAVDLPVMYVALSSESVMEKMFTPKIKCPCLELINTVSSPGDTKWFLFF